MPIAHFSLRPTGNRWQVPAADDAQRRPDGAVDQAGPGAEDLRVPREAAANSAPEEQRLVAPRARPQHPHHSDNQHVRRPPPPGLLPLHKDSSGHSGTLTRRI